MAFVSHAWRCGKQTKCFVTFFALTIITLIEAQRPDFEVPSWAVNKLFWWSSDAPVSTFLNNHPDAISSSSTILNYIESVEEAVLLSLKNRTVPGPNAPLRVCNSRRSDWDNSALTFFGMRGWADPSMDCVTELYGTRISEKESPRYSVDQVYDAITTRGRTIDGLTKSIAEQVKLGNWSGPELVYECPLTKLSQRCILHPIGSVRVNGNWHLITSITNAPKDQQLPDFERQFLLEYMRVGDGKFVQPLLMRLPRRFQDGEPSVIIEDTTTSLDSWGGAANPSFFGNTFPEENLAMLDSLDATDLLVQQAEDAMTPSSISILALPLLLNVVPISLLAEVSTMTTLLYILLSDVLTTIPIGIKGVELIYIGRQRRRSIVTRMTSTLDGSVSETAASELWAAECGAHENVLTTGIIFVALAFVFVVFGVVAEFVARKYSKKRNAARRKRLLEAGSLLSGKGKEQPEEPGHKGHKGDNSSGSTGITEARRRSDENYTTV